MFPEKWGPVFRKEHAQIKESRAHPDLLDRDALQRPFRPHIASPAPPRYGPAGKGRFRMARSASDTDFGFRRVPLGTKQALVDDVFHSVARRYDLMNDLMSGGLHRAWKAALVTAVNPPKGPRPFAVL